MLRAIQMCVLAIKALEMRDGTSGQPFDFKDALWLATLVILKRRSSGAGASSGSPTSACSPVCSDA
ncbi:hypothetical protein PR002_g12198 [Phytophthora rubi]|nr:hypothetical protein PR002_g12198 [Phytophthora rubi]